MDGTTLEILKAAAPLALLLALSPARAADWPMFRGNPARTGFTAEQAAPPLVGDWTFDTGAGGISSPAVFGGRVYAGSRDGAVYALDAATGALLWRFQTASWVDSSPAVSTYAVYAASMDGHLYALDPLTGAPLWRADLGAPSVSSPLLYQGRVYVGSGLPENKLKVFDALSGAPLGAVQAGQPVDSAPSGYGGTVYFGANDGAVYAAAALSLLAPPGWLNYPTAGSFRMNAVAAADGNLYALSGHDDKKLSVLSAATGNLVKESAALSSGPSWQTFTSPAAAGGLVYFAGGLGATAADPAGSSYLSAVDTRTAASVWASSPSLGGMSAMGLLSSPVMADDVIYCATADSRLLSVSSTGASAASPISLSSAAYASPAVANGRIFVAAGDGRLAAFRARRTAAIAAPAQDSLVFSTVVISGYVDNPALTGYKLEYGEGTAPAAWTLIFSSAAAAPLQGAELGRWDVSGLPNGPYSLRLTVLETGTPLYNNSAVVTLRVDTPPAPPSALTAADAPGDSGNRIDLAWTPSPTAATTAYRILRSAPAQAFAVIAVVSSATLSYTDAAAVTGSTFTYAVRAYDGYSESADSNLASAFSVNNSGDFIPPAAVMDLSAAPGPVPGSVALYWTAPGNDGNLGRAALYTIKYTTVPGYGWSAFDQGPGLAARLRKTEGPAGAREADLFTGLLGGATYYFALKTQDYVPNLSAISNIAAAYAVPDSAPPAPPYGLQVEDTPFDSGNSLTLSWSLSAGDVPGGNVHGYKIFRRSESGGYAALAPYAQTGPGAAGYADGAAPLNMRFCYAVAAFNSAGDSPLSGEACGVSADNWRFLDSSQGGYLSLPDGARVDIPPGASNQNDKIMMFRLPAADQRLSAVRAAGAPRSTPVAYELRFLNPASYLVKPVQLTMPYTDAETAGMDQENLRIYTLSGGSWRMLDNSVPDPANKKVSAGIIRFSVFRLMEYVPSGAAFLDEEVYTYPNPATGDALTFKFRLAYKSRVKISVYNVAGEQVAELERTDCPAGQTSEIRWDISRIASGVYLYRLEAQSSAGGRTLVKKLAIAH